VSTPRCTPGNACVNAWVLWHDTFFLADAEFLDEEIIDLMYYIVEKFKKKVNPIFTCFLRKTPFPVSFAVQAALECLRGGRWPAIGIQRLACKFARCASLFYLSLQVVASRFLLPEISLNGNGCSQSIDDLPTSCFRLALDLPINCRPGAIAAFDRSSASDIPLSKRREAAGNAGDRGKTKR
jgi:hypothetical protein